MDQIRLDKKGNRLFKGERERGDGRYEYRYTDYNNERHYVYAYRLAQLRKEEAKIVFREHNCLLYGMTELTLNDLYDMWIASKSDLKESTRQKRYGEIIQSIPA